MENLQKLIERLFDLIGQGIVLLVLGAFVFSIGESLYDVSGLKNIIEGEEEDNVASYKDEEEVDTVDIRDLMAKDHSEIDCELTAGNDYINHGSMKGLSGKTCVAVAFIATEDNDWTEDGKQVAIDSLFCAERWLKSEAKKYGSNIDFCTVTFRNKETIYVDEIPSKTEDDDKTNDNGIIHQTHLALGYDDMHKASDTLKAHHKCDNVVMVVFAKRTGRAWAEVFSKADVDADRWNRYLESCIVFSRKRFSNGGSEPLNAGTIAHEILHLAGAWDLYKDSAQPDDHAEKAEELFPKSIMIQSSPWVTQRQIDPLTAWLVGINDNPKSWYAWFDPGNEEEWNADSFR